MCLQSTFKVFNNRNKKNDVFGCYVAESDQSKAADLRFMPVRTSK